MTDDAAGTAPAFGERREKPPGLSSRYAEVFLHEDVARAYRYRPPHPAAAVDLLNGLLRGEGGAVLDVGCGTGELARRLLDEADRVDAVDVSQAMIEVGRGQERGDDPRLRWIWAPIEEAPLEPPYALIVAGDSLQWTDWYVSLPRLHDVLAPQGTLALVQRGWGTRTAEEGDILSRYSANQEYRPHDLVEELESRGLFRTRHRLPVAQVWRPTIEEYVESRHAQAGCARHVIGPDRSAAFDTELGNLLRSLVGEGRLRAYGERLNLQVWASITWGEPQPAP
jgi:SAM-dependent methyltransferase